MKFLKTNIFTIICFIVMLGGVVVRFYKLGFPESFGDEINTLKYLGNYLGSNPTFNQFYDFLLRQNRGPGQYIVNYVNTFLFGYVSEFQIRLPFFLLSIAAFYTTYILAKEIFNKRIALISVVLVSINGLYIAFSKVAQYQSFIYTVVPWALLLFYLGHKNHKLKPIIGSGLILSVSLLFHYDTVVSLLFIGFYLIYDLVLNLSKKNFLYNLKIGSLFSALFIALPVAFYTQLYFHDFYKQKTESYLSERIWEGNFYPNTPYKEVGKVLSIYMPLEIWFLLLGLILLALFFYKNDVSAVKLWKIKIPEKYTKILYQLSVIGWAAAFVFSIYPIKPRLSSLLIYIFSLGIISLLLLSKKIKPVEFALASYWIVSCALYFFFIGDPRTHVYTSFIPAFILAAKGFELLLLGRYTKHTAMVLGLLAVIYTGMFYWTIYFTPGEYPWDQKYLLGRKLGYINRKNLTGDVRGVFGFSNNRHWKEIRQLYESGCLVGTYNSNEKAAVTDFYMGKPSKDVANSVSIVPGADNAIFVKYPSQFSVTKVESLANNPLYTQLKVFYNDGEPVTYIYGKIETYPNKKMLCE